MDEIELMLFTGTALSALTSNNYSFIVTVLIVSGDTVAFSTKIRKMLIGKKTTYFIFGFYLRKSIVIKQLRHRKDYRWSFVDSCFYTNRVNGMMYKSIKKSFFPQFKTRRLLLWKVNGNIIHARPVAVKNKLCLHFSGINKKRCIPMGCFYFPFILRR